MRLCVNPPFSYKPRLTNLHKAIRVPDLTSEGKCMIRRTLVIVLAAAGLLAAQDPPTRAGRISYVSGAVSFQPAGVSDWVGATVNRPLTTGDQLYADSGGRAEVHVPGTAFRLGDKTAFEFLNLDDRSAQVRLSEGTLDLRVRNLYGNIEIDTPNMAFTVSRPGEYRFDANVDSGQTLVTARDGQGQVIAGGGSFALSPGQQAVITGQGQTAQYTVNAAPGYDAFDNWVKSRYTNEDRYANSGYVSPQMVGYEDLGEYGTWRSTPDYGQVWVPNSVASGWAPYHDGQWAWVDPWGWTWVDDSPWGFAPFHYGRWAYVNGSWGWCPGPTAGAAIYAPALVAWVAFGAGFDVSIGGGSAVGWFALGPRDVYIPSFTASAAFVTQINVTNTTFINTTVVNNAYSGYLRTNTMPVASYMNRTVPGAMVAVPQTALTGAQSVQKVAMRLQPNQIAAIKSGASAPKVAPQMASVLGHSAGGNVPRPPAAVLSHPIVAKTAPPPPPPSFQQRQALLARNPGRPVPVAQLHQLASTHAAGAPARPPVTVMSHARPVTPQAAKGGASANVPSNTQARPAPGETRPPAPQAAQQHAAPPQPAHVGSRSSEPPAAQQHASAPPQPARMQPHTQTPQTAQQRAAVPPAQPAHPASAPHEQPRVQAPQHAAVPPAQPAHPASAPHEQPRVQAPQHAAAPPAQPAHPAAAPHEQPHVQAQQRPPAPAPQAERQSPPPHAQPHTQAQPKPAAPPRPATPPPAHEQPKKEAPPERKPEEH
jgi:hypothetical protein